MKVVGTRRVFSVEEVGARLAAMFDGLRSFWVEAEIQEVRPARGQVYFTLRGENAIDAHMNRIVFDRLAATPADGDLVQAYGRIEFWSKRSQVRMRVERLEPAGDGLLRARIAELRARLAAEGLLDPARRRPVPLLPRRVGLVTSAVGAARDDFLRNAWARFPAADILLVDVPVQGDDAPRLIARAVRHLDAVRDVDVIVVARGGGSLEDLMAFNSEPACRAVAAAATPVVSAVGHERDVTLCDEVADLRVSTPTAAAEAVLPSMEALRVRLADAQGASVRGLLRARAAAERETARRAADLVRALRGRGAVAGDRVERLAPRLGAALARRAARAPGELDAAGAALARAGAGRVAESARRVERAEALLGLLSPRATVARGYAIVREAATDAVVADAGAVAPGAALSIEMRDGRLPARARGRP
ncbi:MAG: exodeoxyribonuclease VII large subunit [Thermoleophilia bacterium]